MQPVACAGTWLFVSVTPQLTTHVKNTNNHHHHLSSQTPFLPEAPSPRAAAWLVALRTPPNGFLFPVSNPAREFNLLLDSDPQRMNYLHIVACLLDADEFLSVIFPSSFLYYVLSHLLPCLPPSFFLPFLP